MRSIAILGCRGIPAAHGGFETFAERLALHLVERGWTVSVYCQVAEGDEIGWDLWKGVERLHVPVHFSGPLGTIEFDFRSIRHAARTRPGVVLTLGYNTAIFCAWYRLARIRNVINMDGLEWKRAKWSPPVRLWFYLNERIACRLGDALIADHPEILRHLATHADERKLVMIPYGADALTTANQACLARYGLKAGQYALLIARPEPENSVREMVAAFARCPRGLTLAVLGQYRPERNPYHREVMRAASDEVIFLGAIYDKNEVEALRYFCRLYLHGHQVGGTNPSLVEALGAGNAVLAHDNGFNRWVAGAGARYFSDADECAAQLDAMLDDAAVLGALRLASRVQHRRLFTWDKILGAYETLLESWYNRGSVRVRR